MRLSAILIALIVMLPAVLSGQHYYSMAGERPETDSIRPNELSASIRSALFFRNNEYNARSVKGYTLPGARISAFASYLLPAAHGVKLSLGVSTLNYWGASRYPAGIAYSDLPYWTDYNDYVRLRILPYVQAMLKPTATTALMLGNIAGGTAHGLIEPIYNPELDLTADPEAGVQFRGDWTRFRMDVWVNWMSMIFKNDNHQESFVFGLSTTSKLLSGEGKWRLELPLQAIATHRGGEYNWAQQDTVHTWVNGAVGLKLSYRPRTDKPMQIWGSAYGVAALSSGGYFPYERGWGGYLSLGMDLEHFAFRTDYWYGRHYVSPFAAPFANSLTYDKQPLTNGWGDYIRLYADYSWRMARSVSLAAVARVWFQPSDRFAMSHALELTMRIDSNFPIAFLKGNH
ncbi:hypothetical protein HMPREF1989_00651 [Porphyromonas gingivalis F0566]|uniref:lipid A deacylase n=1 Tax=Porphyromonas gingivalis TaxID=837 RepID=UPI0003AD0619|nr:lipid A deacylase [Porphyromonas gingivalis]ERJ87505.1 hypothetical protein HMPREF1989_00651 [Porphyromonas gingivalis F0566]